MRPMGRPKPGLEKRFIEIFEMLSTGEIPKQSFVDKLKGKKPLTKDDLLAEWFAIQIPSYETIKAPWVGRDKEAEDWVREKYSETDKSVSEEDFRIKHEGFYVIELAKERDGVPVYVSALQDENVFRGQFIADCVDLIGDKLANEAWETKQAEAALDYGIRLWNVAEKVAADNKLEFLKNQYFPPDTDEDTIESKLHILYSLAKWLIFYGKNGHGYEADF